MADSRPDLKLEAFLSRLTPNGFAILLRVNLYSASEAREPDAFRDCSNRLLYRDRSCLLVRAIPRSEVPTLME